MSKLVVILLLCLVILPDYAWSQEGSSESLAICLLDIKAPPDSDLGYIVEAVSRTISNRLSQFPNIIAYPGDSAPARYFREPEKILTADKVRLLQIRRETGFDGLIFGKVDENEGVVSLLLNLVDFSSGSVYFSGEIQGTFGSELFIKLEEKVSAYVYNLVSYYNSTLAVTSDPTGAEVLVNGKTAGVTPIYGLQVKDRMMQVQIKMEGYIPFETKVELQAGQKGSVYAQLKKPPPVVVSTLTATSEPTGADVYMNDKFLGTTPIKDLPVEQQKFSVKFTNEGFAPYSDFVSLNPGQQAYIHAELRDLLTEHLRKKSLWRIDAHNFSFYQTLEIQNLEELDIRAYPAVNFRYYAKFGRVAAGLGMSVNRLNAEQNFDTFVGTGEGYEPFTLDIVKGMVFTRYNILERVKWLEIYLGGFTGVSLSTATQDYAPLDMDRIQKASPLVGGEIGLSFYLLRVLKLSAIAGSYYAGEIEYAAKEAAYWGEPTYERRRVDLHPFYIGFELAFSLWPALIP